MRVFKSTYKDRAGQTRQTQRWYAELRDHRQTIRRFPGFSSKAATAEMGRNLERLVAYSRSSGGQLDPALVGWLEKIPLRIRDRLCRIGLIDPQRAGAAKPLVEHVDDFRQALLDRENTLQHVNLTANRVRAIADGIGAQHLSEVTEGCVSRYLAERRRGGLSIASSNHHLTAIKGFFRWLIRERRVVESPVVHLMKLNAKTDRRHVRRVLDLQEFRRLLSVTHDAPTRYGMTGPERAVCYRLASESGFRVRELSSLTPASFELNGTEPSVTVVAGYSKRRRLDNLPLRPDTAAALRAHLANKTPRAPAFNLPAKGLTAEMVRADLADAGIDYEDDAGRVYDFHALRHQFASALAAADVHPKDAQELLRHSSISLTMDVYTHTTRRKLASALDALPSLDTPERDAAKATGTDNITPKNVLASSLALSDRDFPFVTPRPASYPNELLDSSDEGPTRR